MSFRLKAEATGLWSIFCLQVDDFTNNPSPPAP